MSPAVRASFSRMMAIQAEAFTAFRAKQKLGRRCLGYQENMTIINTGGGQAERRVFVEHCEHIGTAGVSTEMDLLFPSDHLFPRFAGVPKKCSSACRSLSLAACKCFPEVANNHRVTAPTTTIKYCTRKEYNMHSLVRA